MLTDSLPLATLIPPALLSAIATISLRESNSSNPVPTERGVGNTLVFFIVNGIDQFTSVGVSQR